MANAWDRLAGEYAFPPKDRVVYGKPAAQAIADEAQRLQRQRAYLVVSNTLNRTTSS